MGFSTNITIQNDFWHEIAARPNAFISAISVGMNDGAGGDSPILDALDAQPDAQEYRKRLAYERRWRDAPQGVTVHRAQHNDVPQVIVNTHARHALAAHELPSAIRDGWLKLPGNRAQHAVEIVNVLEDLASRIREALDSEVGKE